MFAQAFRDHVEFAGQPLPAEDALARPQLFDCVSNRRAPSAVAKEFCEDKVFCKGQKALLLFCDHHSFCLGANFFLLGFGLELGNFGFMLCSSGCGCGFALGLNLRGGSSTLGFSLGD